MAMAGADSDDEVTIVKEIPAAREQNLSDLYRLLKKPKVEGGATTSAIGEATAEGNQIRIRLAPWPTLSSELGFYRNAENMKNLEAGKLVGFLIATLVPFEIQDELVEEFVASYRLEARSGFVGGKRLDLGAEVVSRALKLPNYGVSWNQLKLQEYPIGGCFSTPNALLSTESETRTPIRVLKTELTSDWREMVEFVQRWLFLDVDPASADLGVVVATVALFRHGVPINWAELVARRLHQLVEDVKIRPSGGESMFHGGYFMTKILSEANAVDLSSVKMETNEGGSQSLPPGVPSPLQGGEYYQASIQLALLSKHPTIFEDYAELRRKHDLLHTEHQLLQVEAEKLKKAMADATGERAAMVEEMKKAMADSTDLVANDLLCQLKQELPSLVTDSAETMGLRSQLERLQAEAVDQKKKYGALNSKHIQTQLDAQSQKQKIEELTAQSANLEQELLNIQKGKGIGDAEEEFQPPPTIQREAHITVDGIADLSYFIPPAQNLERAYTYDRQVFFMLNGLIKGQTLTQLEFQQIWKWAEDDNFEDLLVEILVRGDLKLEDYVKAYWLIGDLGARLLRYYCQLEDTQMERQRLETQCAENVRKPKCAQWAQVVASRLATQWGNSEIEEWQSVVNRLLTEFQSEGWLLQMIKHSQSRLVRTRFSDIHPSEYFYTYQDTKLRLERLGNAKNFSQLLPFEIYEDATFKNKYNWQIAPEVVVGMPPHLDSWSFGTSASITDDQFLGKWENLFGTVDDRSDTLLWEALLWIGKDYNHEQAPLSKPIEALIAGESNLRLEIGEVPEKVAENPHFCCTSKRRYKWRIDAQVDTVWYNWPEIPGVWGNYVECVTSYTNFWQEHKTHRDPVCFRAAIFCKALAEWCQFFRIIIDARLGGRMLQDGELYARLNYNCCRKMRLLELMFMMQFLQGAHNNLIGDKKTNRKGAMDSFVYRDRDGTLKEERAKWRELSVQCDNANREALRRGATRPMYQMPLQWSNGCNFFPISYPVPKNVRPAKAKEGATIPIGTSSKK